METVGNHSSVSFAEPAVFVVTLYMGGMFVRQCNAIHSCGINKHFARNHEILPF